MPDENIQWKISVRNTREEIVSSDSRWSLIRNETTPGATELFLSNFDLLLSPCSHGASIFECFEKFIVECDRYAEKLAKVRSMAEKQLEAMRSNARKHENAELQIETKKTAPVFTDTAFISGKTDARIETE